MFFFPLFLFAQFDFNSNCREAYRSILSLHFTEAGKILNAEKATHPFNLIPVYLENYIDFFSVFIGEEPSVFEKFRKTQELRFDILKKGNMESPYYRYCLGNMRIQFALCRMKFGEYKSAALDISRANGDLKENAQLHPDFLLTNSGLGLIHVLAGVIPDNYSWILRILGLEGNVQKGLDEIAVMAGYAGNNKTYQLFRIESMFYLTFLDATLGKDANNALWILKKFEDQKTSFPGFANPLLIFIKASILTKAGKTDEALQNLQEYHTSSEEFPFYYLEYLTGLNKLNRLDPDADLYFIRFLKNFRGQNYIKSGYQKLAWTFLIKGNILKYEEYIGKALNRGALLVDNDIQANREAKYKEQPNIILLKTRLLSDGGYVDRAIHLLMDQSVKSVVKTPKDLLEYNYRLGRIYQQSGKQSEALKYFGITMRDGADQSWYFAENAALQSGMIYEQNKEYRNAAQYYKLCLSMKNTEYKNSLDQKARLGMKRIKPYLP
ncbi:MAG: tetratricopeptide repeat protein [Bacteroidales bacterium]